MAAEDGGQWRWWQAPRQPDQQVDQVVRRCGQLADLVIDSVLPASNAFHPVLPLAMQLSMQVGEAARLLRHEPLQRALQLGRSRCALCSPLGHLRVLSVTLSGSTMEGLRERATGSYSQSDKDAMCQLGPVRWQPAEGHSGPSAVPLLTAVPTDHPGFVRLLQRRRPECAHQQPLELQAGTVRQWMRDLMLVVSKPGMDHSSQGPATTTSAIESWDLPARETDMVPCLHAPWWPAEEFQQRSRAHNWPPEAVTNNIVSFGVHLVPTGCDDSRTREYEWRLSFSRAEVVTAWLLTDVQRFSMLAIKKCKSLLGLRGRGVKSYFFKTSLLWLVQERPADHWTSVTKGARMILDFLDAAIARHRLPCFFWADINLFRSLTANELEKMRQTTDQIRRNMTQLLLRFYAQADPFLGYSLQSDTDPDGPMPERHLRVGLARRLIVKGVMNAVNALVSGYGVTPVTFSQSYQGHNIELPMTRRYVRYLFGVTTLHVAWFHALLMAAPAGGLDWPPLVAAGDGTFYWDAAPLVNLLTDVDMALLLASPAEVYASSAADRAALRRPPALSAASGVTRGLAELLLRPPLLLNAVSRCVPNWWTCLQQQTMAMSQRVLSNGSGQPTPFEEARQYELQQKHQSLADWLRYRLGWDVVTARHAAHHWEDDIQRHWNDPLLAARYRQQHTVVQDAWQLLPFAVGGAG